MSRFNAAPKLGTRSPIVTGSTVMRTALGGAGFERDARSELFLLAVSSMVSTKGNHHEAGDARDARMIQLIEKVASDPDWIQGFVRFLRDQANLRTVSLMIAAHAVHYRLAVDLTGNRHIISAALRRADEPGELVAYWRTTFGREIPKPVRRGIGDAIARLYTEFNVIKYDTPGKGYSFRDVIRVVHSGDTGPAQADLFNWLLRATPSPRLTTINARTELMAVPVEQRRSLTSGQLREAGMTWEAYSSLVNGPMDAAAWEKVIPLMGYMSLLRNLRNFDQAGISRAAERLVEDRLTDPEQVRWSRQLPMRFLSAYRATHGGATVSSWPKVIEQALNLSLANVPSLTGRTLVLVDLSGSMYQSKVSDNSDLRYVDAAAVFGAALALRAEAADLYGFGWKPLRFRFGKGDSLLPLAQRLVDTQVDGGPAGHHGQMFSGLGGTETPTALRQTFRPDLYKRIVIVTDEQYTGWVGSSRVAEVDAVLAEFDVPAYTWNLAGYKVAQSPSGSRKRHTFGGLNDSAFRMIPLLEAGQSQDWDKLFAPVRQEVSTA